jgi:hypothetical protein
MAMAVPTGVALLCHAANLYLLRAPAQAERAARPAKVMGESSR